MEVFLWVLRWCDGGTIIKLNIGCGNDIRDGWVNLDKFPVDNRVKYFDIEDIPYSFKKDSIDEIYCSHTLEHINKIDSIIHEFTRILKYSVEKDVGICTIKLPVFSNGWKHKSWYHLKTYFYSLYGEPWKAKAIDSYESELYTNSKYDLIYFKKNINFRGINYCYWFFGQMKNRFLSWVNSFIFNEYEWKIKIKKNDKK